jgi:hypothetical protein
LEPLAWYLFSLNPKEMRMSAKLSVDEVLANLEQRAVFHREQAALHAQKMAEHQAEQAFHAAELEKVLRSLEAFRKVAAEAVDLAQPVPAAARPAETIEDVIGEDELPPPGRFLVNRLLRLAVERTGLAEPFSATAAAAEVNRRFADRLRAPVQARTASDVLRQMAGEGLLRIARKGKPFQEALYVRRPSTE